MPSAWIWPRSRASVFSRDGSPWKRGTLYGRLKAGNPVWPYCIGQRFHGDRSCFFTDCQVTGKLNDQNGQCFQTTCQRERKYWRFRSVGSRCENSYSRLSLDLGRLWLESWSELQCLGPTKTDIVGFEKAFLRYQIPKEWPKVEGMIRHSKVEI